LQALAIAGATVFGVGDVLRDPQAQRNAEPPLPLRVSGSSAPHKPTWHIEQTECQDVIFVVNGITYRLEESLPEGATITSAGLQPDGSLAITFIYHHRFSPTISGSIEIEAQELQRLIAALASAPQKEMRVEYVAYRLILQQPLPAGPLSKVFPNPIPLRFKRVTQPTLAANAL
jgi:hypothetical protein